MELRDKVKKVNEILKSGEPGNWSKDHKGYSGYKPQAIIDAVNIEFIGEWSIEVLEHTTYPTKGKSGTINNAFVKIKLTLGGVTMESYASHPIQTDPGDAFKSAQTDAMKKAMAHFSIGNRAYHGLLQ